MIKKIYISLKMKLYHDFLMKNLNRILNSFEKNSQKKFFFSNFRKVM